jgi:hypothetical protein
MDVETAAKKIPKIKVDCKPSPPRPSTSRQHGKNMRRLVKLVSAAFLNPREFETHLKKLSLKTFQFMFLGMSRSFTTR